MSRHSTQRQAARAYLVATSRECAQHWADYTPPPPLHSSSSSSYSSSSESEEDKSPLAQGANQLGTSTTGDVRPASPAAAAPVVVGDEAEAERFFEEYILCHWFSPEVLLPGSGVEPRSLLWTKSPCPLWTRTWTRLAPSDHRHLVSSLWPVFAPRRRSLLCLPL